MNWRDHYKKAITFSYDDANVMDLHLLEILNKYNLKCTFNVNTGQNMEIGTWFFEDKLEVHHLNLPETVEAYKGHEIAVHTVTHPDLTKLSEEEIRKEVACDRDTIEEIYGVRPVGMAYPYGTYNDKVVKVLEEEGILYSRGVESSHNFDEQEDLLRFKPTCHHEDENIMALAKKFVEMQPDTPQIFYIWGHSYEFEGHNAWDEFEDLCKFLANRDDIFYGTNKEVLL